MSDDWYCEAGGQRHGPVPLRELRAKLQGADLQDVFVWCDQYDDWKCAADIPELGPQPRQPPFPGPDQKQDGTSAPDKKRAERGLGWRVLVIIGGGSLSTVLARNFGPVLWMPAALIAITWLILAKCKVNRVIAPMLAILIGHTAWGLIGFSLLYAVKGMTDAALYFGLDLVVVAGLSIWAIARQSIPSAVGILLYQLAVLANMAIAGDELNVGTTAIAMHVLLRALGLAAAIYAIAAGVVARIARSGPTD
jgi:hypothetical protein